MKRMIAVLGSVLFVLIEFFLSSFLATILTFFVVMFSQGSIYGMGLTILHGAFLCSIITLFSYISYKKNYSSVGHLIYTPLVCITFMLIFVITKASLLHPLTSMGLGLAFPFIPTYFLMSLFSNSYHTMMIVGITLIYSLCLILFLNRKDKYIVLPFICLSCGVICFMTYFNSPHYKYKNQGHDFAYMNGYSSIDLSDYTPYSESGKLVLLDHQPEFRIEKESDMPILDGAEACYPVYSALAKTLYKDIDLIEKEYLDTYKSDNGKIVTFYNTAIGFERLLAKDVDMFFGARPSASQLEEASRLGIELEYTEIGKEAFVFFVEEDNPIDGLTSEQIRQIYSGQITNWKEVGGKDEKIVAFQRPERSGSQSMMVYFMGDVPLKEPLTYEMEYAMLGIIEEVAQYQNEAGAIGYTFRYFLEGLNQVEGVKMLKVDGVYPTSESISQSTYPIVTSLYCITDKNTTHPNVKKVLDFLLSKDGQSLIKQNGYSPIN